MCNKFRFRAGVVGVLFLLGTVAAPAQAASLSSDQENAIIALIQSFGANSSVIANVQSILAGGQSGTSYVPAVLGVSTSEITASLNAAMDVAFDHSGNLYVLTGNISQGNQVLRRSVSSGAWSVFAGTGIAGFGGDGGPATLASFSAPSAIAVDQSSGAVFVSDRGNQRVRRIDPTTNIVTTVAGGGAVAGAVSGPATSAKLSNPGGISLDTSGNLYIADSSNNQIRKVNLQSGIISTVAGNGQAYVGRNIIDGSAATAVELPNPSDVVTTPAGELYISQVMTSGNGANLHDIFKVDTVGRIYKVAGANPGFYGDGGLATAALLKNPSNLTVSPSGDVWISDSGNERIRKIASGTISSVVGGVRSENGYPAELAKVTPVGLAFDNSGNVYFTDSGTVKWVNKSSSSDLSKAIMNTLSSSVMSASDVAFDPQGRLYVADSSGNRVWRRSASGNWEVFAGSGSLGFSGDGGLATAASLRAPNSIAINASGTVFINDFGNQRVRRVDSSTGIITTTAGSGVNTGVNDGSGIPATAAWISSSLGISLDGLGNLYIADTNNNRIRKVNLQTGMITTIAGNGVANSTGDGGLAIVAHVIPKRIMATMEGDVYFTEFGSSVANKIRKIDHATGIISTVAGVAFGYAGDGGLATSAQLNGPNGLAMGPGGELWVADTNNGVIRRISGGIISSVVGSSRGDGYSAELAKISPKGMAFNVVGDLYVVDNQVGVRWIDASTNSDLSKALIKNISSAPVVSPTTYALSVTRDSQSSNTVPVLLTASVGTPATCSSYPCNFSGVPSTVSVTLVATPPTNTSVSWLSGCSSTTATTCTINAIHADTTVNAKFMTVVVVAKPVADFLLPQSIVAKTPNTLLVYGSGFVTGTKVRIDGSERSDTQVLSTTLLRLDSGAADFAAAGNHLVTVKNPDGQVSEQALTLVVTAPPVVVVNPVLLSLSQEDVVAGSDSFPLLVYGSNFASGAKVKVDGVSHDAIGTLGSTGIWITMAKDEIKTAGKRSVMVVNPDGGTSTPLTLTVSAAVTPPIIPPVPVTYACTGAVPTNASVYGSDTTGLTADTTYTYSASDTATKCEFSCTSGYSWNGGSCVQVVVAQTPAPVTTGFGTMPNTISTGSSGFQAKMYGSNFVSGATVTINGVTRSATSVDHLGARDAVTFPVLPSDLVLAGERLVTITNPDGKVSNPQYFWVGYVTTTTALQAKVGQNYVAGGGVVEIGSQITNAKLRGTAFSPTSVVRVNGAPRTTIYASQNALSFDFLSSDTVNLGTLSITVMTQGAGISNAQTITVIPSNTVSAGGVSQTANVLNGLSNLDQTPSTQSSAGFQYHWTHDLQIGSPYAADVSALQTALTLQGIYGGEITGGFYSQTYLAVKKFQERYGIESTGFVGPQTRAKLSELY